MKKYGVYNNSKVGNCDVKHMEGKNGLFIAVVLIGISFNQSIRDLLDIDERYDKIINIYESEIDHDTYKSPYFKKGKKYISDVMRLNGEKISNRKARYYLIKNMNGVYYVDTMITHFARAVYQSVNTDPALLKALGHMLKSECKAFAVDRKPTADDCVAHIFGFQYEILKDIVSERYNVTGHNSKKTLALRTCFNEMKSYTMAEGYPKCT